MKSIWTKVPAIVGRVLSVRAWLGFALFLILISLEDSPIHLGIGLAWLTVEFILTVCGLCLLLLDAVFSFIKCFMKIDRGFNLALSLAVLGLIALLCFVVIKYLYLILCLLISLAIIALEIVSFVRHIKMNKQKAE